MQYRRAKTKGGTYVFTVVTHQRRKFLCRPANVSLLREAFRTVMAEHPFQIDAIVLLPEHLHCIWTLPSGDHDFSTRWRLIKSYFTRHCDPVCHGPLSPSRRKKQERAVWQRRFWEHQIRDERDFTQHVEYMHYNYWTDLTVAFPPFFRNSPLCYNSASGELTRMAVYEHRILHQ